MKTKNLWIVGVFGAGMVCAACEKAPAPKPPAPPSAPKATVAEPAAGASAGGDAAAGAGAKTPDGPTPKDVPATKTSGENDDPTKIEIGGLTMDKPVVWVWTRPTQSMRTLQYAVPAVDTNAPAAELTFSMFTGTDGGPLASNLDRWASFFRTEDGSQAPHVRTEFEVNGRKVAKQESEGSYVGMMGQAAPRPGYAQFGAIIDAGDRRIFIKLVGPKATVESNRAQFDAMLKSVR